jgi:outer membrane biosynthesis protein TonB
MTPKLLVITLVGAGTIAAAAAGGYTALRRDAPEAPAASLQTDVAVPQPEPVVEPVVLDAPAETAPVQVARVQKQARVDTAREPVRTSRAPRKSAPVEAPAPSAPVASTPAATPVYTPVPSEAPTTDASDVRYEPTPTPAEPAAPATEELTVERDAVIGIRLESAVSSQTARVEDKVTARIARDVAVNGYTALSSGSRLEGVVSSVERGGKFKDRARIGITFNTLVLADNTRLPIQTETIFRETDSPTKGAVTRVGAGAAIGGVLGAVIGGKKGAVIGSTVGAAGGAATVAAGASPDAALAAGTPLTLRLTSPITLTIQRQN